MKRKYLAVLLGAILTMSSVGSVSVMAEAETAEAAAEDVDSQDEDVTYGEVQSVGENTLTISVGTLNMEMGGGDFNPENSDGEMPEASEEKGSDSTAEEEGEINPQENAEDGEAPELPEDSAREDFDATQMDASSMLELTGEELTVTITDSTVITRQSIGGGMRGGMDGEASGADAGQAPDGMGEAPDGEGGEMPDGEGGEMPDGEDGEAPDGEGSEIPDGEGEAAENPDGNSGDGQALESGDEEMPEMPFTEAPDDAGEMGGSEEIALEDIQEGDVVALTVDDAGNALTVTVVEFTMGGQGMGGQAMGGGESASGVDSYTAVSEYSEDEIVSGVSLESTGTDENAALVDSGAEVTFDGVQVTRTSQGSTGGDNSSFYGVGAALLTTDGTSYITGSTISTDASGGAGVFAYGDGVTYVADTAITTVQDTSGGIHAAGGGTLYAWDLVVNTSGESAAAIRSDRGGGTMIVNGGTYTSNGVGSPAVYCTADIAVNNSTLTANGSEGICIEGLNTLHLFDCALSSNMSDSSQNDTTWSIILYQSMSGDSEVGNSTFQMSGGSITSANGGIFYTTNTEATITLKDVEITASEDCEFFLQCTGNTNERGWGSAGANGSDCNFTAIAQGMSGDVIWDTISDLDFYMTEGSTLTGAVVQDNTWAGEGGDGYCNLYIDGASTWIVTGDSTVTSLQNAGSIVDADGNTVSIVGSDGTVYVEGTSAYTVTVDSYADTADVSGCTAIDEWSSYEVERPSNI